MVKLQENEVNDKLQKSKKKEHNAYYTGSLDRLQTVLHKPLLNRDSFSYNVRKSVPEGGGLMEEGADFFQLNGPTYSRTLSRVGLHLYMHMQ